MKKLLFVDHHDSFSYNLIAALHTGGCEVTVLQSDNIPENRDEITAWIDNFSGVVLSPGPGTPSAYPGSLRLIKALPHGKPLLGVCLGFQLVLTAQGATVAKISKQPRHGQSVFPARPIPSQRLKNFCYEGSFVLYNSLGVQPSDPVFANGVWQNLWSIDDMVLVAEHSSQPHILVQFHPESFASSGGPSFLKEFCKFV